jgi:DNA-binding MarR family transcriptional regulator
MKYLTKNLGVLVRRQKLFDEQAKYLPHITYESLQIMVVLYLSDEGAVPRKVMQKFLKMNGSQLTRTNQALIKAGLIYYEVDINDHRLKLMRLTALGLSLRKLYFEFWHPELLDKTCFEFWHPELLEDDK